MLKLVWTSGAAAAPDEEECQQATDTLGVRLGTASATLGLPRDLNAGLSGRDEVKQLIRQWLAARSLPESAVKLMLHGYDYNPSDAPDNASDPFRLVYGYPGENGLDPRLSWLPLVKECDEQGLQRQETAIAFAWVSSGSLSDYAAAGWGESYEYACVDLVRLAARAVAEVLHILADEGAAVDVMAHSLGTRLFTQAMRLFGPGNGPVNNVILLDGAEYSVDAAAIFAGRTLSVVNVTNDKDKVLTTGAQQLGDPTRLPGTRESCSIGRFGLGTPQSWQGIAEFPPNWVDIALDRDDVQDWFHDNGGYVLTPRASDNVHASGNLNHWACYTEIGNRAWLSDLLWQPEFNGSVFARTPSLPKGILRQPQPVFAGAGIPDKVPMTMMGRIALQQRGDQSAPVG